MRKRTRDRPGGGFAGNAGAVAGGEGMGPAMARGAAEWQGSRFWREKRCRGEGGTPLHRGQRHAGINTRVVKERRAAKVTTLASGSGTGSEDSLRRDGIRGQSTQVIAGYRILVKALRGPAAAS